MRKRKPSKVELTKEQQDVINNKSIPTDLAAFITNLTDNVVRRFRLGKAQKEALCKASRKFRAKLRQMEIEKFGEAHKNYKYWTEQEIKYILTSKDEDSVQSERLNRTIYSIQKKRERELKKRQKGN